jgi:hypothetical protein
MNIDQLFEALPQDLQWEVLTKFVGSHVVRKGKLIQKLVLDSKYRMVMNMHRIQKVAFPYNLDYVHEIAFVSMPSSGRKIRCWQNADRSSDVSYTFSRPHNSTMIYNYGTIITDVYPVDSAPLPLFEKHSYPSYEYTDKKKASRINM